MRLPMLVPKYFILYIFCFPGSLPFACGYPNKWGLGLGGCAAPLPVPRAVLGRSYRRSRARRSAAAAPQPSPCSL